MPPIPAQHHCGPGPFLGIEGGATRTLALLSDPAGRELGRFEAGPSNLKFLTDTELVRRFRTLAAAFQRPAAIGIGLAGAWDESDWSRVRLAAGKVWPRVPCQATHDLEIALAAAPAGPRTPPVARVLILSGTGSGCYGRNAAGATAKMGGWGHLLGDQGSAYAIGLAALRIVASRYDEATVWPDLGARLLCRLGLNEPNQLIDWAQAATKAEIAELALEVFAAAAKGDTLAAGILAGAAGELAVDAAQCARKLAAEGSRVAFVLSGGVLLKQPRFANQVGRVLRRFWPNSKITPLGRESVWGAVELAKQAAAESCQIPSVARPATAKRTAPEAEPVPTLVRSLQPSPTETRNPRSLNLDRLPLAAAIELMLSEDATIVPHLLLIRRDLERALRVIVRALKSGGRLFYVGAGTSGRLGVLDASECPPTFRTPPELVQGIMAGGAAALSSSLEGAEDDAPAGARALQCRRLNQRDVVVGIAASGTTPFVWGALREARRCSASSILVCFNPYLEIPPRLRPTVVLAPNLGPEVLTGSTRLKAGTATKLILNLFTTLAMVRLGKVMSNLMIDLHPSNVKLRDRAIRIVQALTGVTREAAAAELERTGWDVKSSVISLRPRRRKRVGTP